MTDDLPAAHRTHDDDRAPPVLARTRRMTLRELRPADAPALWALGKDPRVTAFLLDAPVSTFADACGLVALAQRTYATRPGCGLWRADDGEGFLGFFSLMPEPEVDELALGGRLHPRAWGRGYALEGGAALCAHAFSTLGRTHVVGVCDPDNRPVPALLARLGFVPDGVTTQAGKPALRFVLRRGAWCGPRLRQQRGST